MEPFVDILAVAAYLSVKISWVYEQVRLDRMPSSKVGHRRRFRLSELEAWVRGSRAAPDPLPAQQGVASKAQE
jgi:excisionase family DNA binding protein